MDFDIGNILYVVITLVAVIVGLLGKKKKNAPQGTGSNGQEGEAAGGFMENIERVLRMGQEDPAVVDLQEYEDDIPGETATETFDPSRVPDAYSSNPDPSQSEEYDQILDRLQNRKSDILTGVSEFNTEPLAVINLEEDESTDYFEIIKDFDAGTAVVYSAIINRVDY